MYKIIAALGVVSALVSYSVPVNGPLSTAISPAKYDVLLSRPIENTSVVVQVPKVISQSQQSLLNLARAQAQRDGHENHELVQGVILQESGAGTARSYKVSGKPGDYYYGVGQLKLGSAREVMSAFPQLWSQYKFQTRTNEELIANLILNQAFNIEVTSKYLKLLQDRYGLTGRDLVNAYNRGPGGVKSIDSSEYHYAIAVEEKLEKMKARDNP